MRHYAFEGEWGGAYGGLEGGNGEMLQFSYDLKARENVIYNVLFLLASIVCRHISYDEI